MVEGSRFRVYGLVELGFKVQGLEFEVEGRGFEILALGSRIYLGSRV